MWLGAGGEDSRRQYGGIAEARQGFRLAYRRVLWQGGEMNATATSSSPAERFLRERLQAAFAPRVLRIVDESHRHAGHAGANASGVGSHFRVRIVADAFADVPRVRRHRMVYDAVRESGAGELGCGIHALAVSALAPSEAG